jgi:hypothetical protein
VAYNDGGAGDDDDDNSFSLPAVSTILISDKQQTFLWCP